jgi:hypothetical protein
VAHGYIGQGQFFEVQVRAADGAQPGFQDNVGQSFQDGSGDTFEHKITRTLPDAG